MVTDHILIVRHDSPMRTVGEAETLAVLSSAELALPRYDLVVDTRCFKEDIEGGHWGASHAYLRAVSVQIRAQADRFGSTKILYFGIAEVPHVIALGAYIGDERLVDARDYDRDNDTWEWSDTAKTLTVVAHGVPSEPVLQSGVAVMRVEISYSISDGDVDAVVGKERLADIRVRPSEGKNPAPGIVKSSTDVAVVRAVVRDALAALNSMRPNTEVVHLFVAAPVSVCFAIGQELRLRNGKDVQTYRYRATSADHAYKPAILLTDGGLREVEKPLSDEEVALARQLRQIWQQALDDVIQHAQALKVRTSTPAAAWYANLYPFTTLPEIAPFPGLKPIWEMVSTADRVSEEPRSEDYEFSKERREWKFSDGLILRMYDAAGRSDDRLRQLARLFFWHEYVHDCQVLTKYTAEDVGSFPNCLERIDYMADAYGIFHHVDLLTQNWPELKRTEKLIKEFLCEQVGDALRSFWTFEEPPPHYEWQERRLRRYMNWYWRRVQVREAPTIRAALQVLARQPCIEVAGFQYRTGRGRIFTVLNEKRVGDVPEIGLTLEDGRFYRMGVSTDLNIEKFMLAFAQHDHEEIDRFFNALYEHARHTGGVYPP
jgi:hypothetical protein